jgi:hypothetical protein
VTRDKELEKLHKELDARNEATKVWIQAETQARDYCNQLQKRSEGLVKALELVAKHGCCVMHNDNGCPGCTAREALKQWRGE